MERWLINGCLADSLPVEDRGLHYGDGLFETMALRHGCIRLFDRHLARLRSGCERLALPITFMSQLRTDISQLIGDATEGTVKLIVTRGQGDRGYALPEHSLPTVCLGFTSGDVVTSAEPARVRFCKTRIGRNESLAGIKTLNRLEQVIARAEWGDDQSYDEGLMCNDRNEVVCGTMTNVFMIKDQVLQTPRIDECGVAGVMRSQIMELARSLGIEVREVNLKAGDLQGADALFLTNALRGIWAVGTLDGEPTGHDAMMSQLQAELENSFVSSVHTGGAS